MGSVKETSLHKLKNAALIGEKMKDKLVITVAMSTTLTVEKAERIAEECGVKIILLDTRMRKDREWVNDFDVEGSPGKVDSFLARVKDVEVNSFQQS